MKYSKQELRSTSQGIDRNYKREVSLFLSSKASILTKVDSIWTLKISNCLQLVRLLQRTLLRTYIAYVASCQVGYFVPDIQVKLKLCYNLEQQRRKRKKIHAAAASLFSQRLPDLKYFCCQLLQWYYTGSFSFLIITILQPSQFILLITVGIPRQTD